MSNPTPILNNINAFDATQGTTISFNIIGGTDIVRSNIVYIYDLSTNDLICTHLYISTESIHELPPNTDSSIVYASGKSSADFVNNKNYYLQVQTFTNTAGTAGGSGMGVAKTFWCLSNPSLSVNAIPAAISTTSYNVGATYTTNITDVTIPVTNIIQQYKFDLYTATGTLVQTSGNIIGSGEQEGTSTTYNITYNFSGLVVNNSYYVIVTTTSTEGMTVSAQSNTFTVSIDTPTVGAATATNNSCDGYISVVSNLSSEYGGTVSGEIASFETDSVNNVSSLKVNMEPIQDLHGYDSPWVGGAGKNKFDLEKATLAPYGAYGLSFAKSGDKVVITGTADTAGNLSFSLVSDYDNYDLSGKGYVCQVFDVTSGYTVGAVWGFRTATEKAFAIRLDGITVGQNINCSMKLSVSATSQTSWTPYSNLCPISGWDSVEAYVTGVNVWDEEWESGYYSRDNGNKAGNSNTTYFRSKNFIPCLPSTTYYIKQPAVHASNSTFCGLLFYDADQNYISARTESTSRTFTTPSNAYYMTFYIEVGASGATYQHDISINYPSTDHEYHAYNGHTHTATFDERVYGGTVDLVSGVLTVDRAMVDLGTLNWSTPTASGRMSASAGAMPITSSTDLSNVISDTYATITARAWYDATATGISICGAGYGTDGNIGIFDPNLAGKTSAEAKSYVTGIYAVYPLATPQTYQLTPQEIRTLVGINNVWSDSGDVEITYNIPITNLLVKRQDVADVSGTWLTLYSQSITQASDMDFTYIDFLNQYGKTYRYALVPLLTQQQGDIDVEIEGGYTVSDDVLSVFDGVFIANNNGSQKLKAATEYGDLETNQDVGVLTTIGNKYPFVVSNSNLNYHSGSISALIVPSDFYTSGDLDRLSIVERREAIEQFLTDKTAKILKDWNGNIWLITFVENVEVSFVDDYGMGLGTLSAKWVEIGDVNDQTDLQQTGLI